MVDLLILCVMLLFSLDLKVLGVLCAFSLGVCVAEYVVKRNVQKQYKEKSKITLIEIVW